MTVTSNETLVRVALTECIENAAKHTDVGAPHIELALSVAESDEYAATITVADDGPGIPDPELTPLLQDREGSLEHASGVGLWAIKWSVERLGGEVEFGDNEPRGSIVRLHLPDTGFEDRYMY